MRDPLKVYAWPIPHGLSKHAVAAALTEAGIGSIVNVAVFSKGTSLQGRPAGALITFSSPGECDAALAKGSATPLASWWP